MEKIKAFIAKHRIAATLLALLIGGVTGYLSNSGYNGAAIIIEEAACNELGVGKDCTARIVINEDELK